MSDVVDVANRGIERELNMALRFGRREEGNLTPIGKCHYCEEPIDRPKLFCSGECADDHDRLSNSIVRR